MKPYLICLLFAFVGCQTHSTKHSKHLHHGHAHKHHQTHEHTHKKACGHKATQHDDHQDYSHGKHKHHQLEGHTHECE